MSQNRPHEPLKFIMSQNRPHEPNQTTGARQELFVQKLALLFWWMLWVVWPWITTLFLLWTFFRSENFARWIPLAYLAWTAYDWNTHRQGGRKNAFLVRFVRGLKVWSHMADYFPIRLIKTVDLDPGRGYLLTWIPAGGTCSATTPTASRDAGPSRPSEQMLWGSAPSHKYGFFVPGAKDFYYCLGSCSATKESMEHLFREATGKAHVLVVGGGWEATQIDPRVVRLTLKRRKGFVKLALRFGVDLVPTFSFGEHHTFVQKRIGSKSVRRFQVWFERLTGLGALLPVGSGLFQERWGPLPRRKPINVVVGSPIRVPKVEAPSVAQVEDLHCQYVEALVKLYEEYNPKYGVPGVDLVIS